MENGKVKRIELLAPAGDLQRAKTAIRYGADAVYLGGQQFSLRSRASNFSIEEIAEACRYAKEHNARIHVTVNMIPHNEDLVGLEEYLRTLEQIGVTAIIVASPSVIQIARKAAPKLEVHLSTQMSVTNSAAARFLSETLGIDRVVLARECTMEEVRSITKDLMIETEAFIHGGMCVNYSGRCTLSNRMTLRDANRGGCAQSCRWNYEMYADGDSVSSTELFTMGSKDLFAAKHIADLIAANVSSLKIEGRMKTEYYVAAVVSGYRHLIDDLYENDLKLSEELLAYHQKEIMKAENREVWDGFYENPDADSSIIYNNESNANVSQEFLAKVVSYDAERKTCILQTRNPFTVGEKVEVLSGGEANRSFIITSLKTEAGEYLERSKSPMVLLEVPVPFEVKEEDIIRRDA